MIKNKRRPWSDTDLSHLRQHSDKTYAELAKDLQRSEGSIAQKLFQLRQADKEANAEESRLDKLEQMMEEVHSKIVIADREDFNKLDPNTYLHKTGYTAPTNPRQAVATPNTPKV